MEVAREGICQCNVEEDRGGQDCRKEGCHCHGEVSEVFLLRSCDRWLSAEENKLNVLYIYAAAPAFDAACPTALCFRFYRTLPASVCIGSAFQKIVCEGKQYDKSTLPQTIVLDSSDRLLITRDTAADMQRQQAPALRPRQVLLTAGDGAA